MALIAHQIQVSHPCVCFRHKPCNRGSTSGSLSSLHIDCRSDNFVTLKCRLCLRGHPVLSSKRRPFFVLSFKGNPTNVGSDGRDRSSRFTKAPFQLSHTPEEREEITTASFDAQNDLSYASQERKVSKGGSLVIQNLFRKWLIMLLTQTPSPKIDKVFGERQVQSEQTDSKQVTLRAKTAKFLQAAFINFLRLDASISLPLVIFIPWFLTIRVMYGAEVTKELTPLWVIGPLVLALYINIIKGLCSLYTFCFMQAVKLVKNLPAYYQLAYSHIVEGQLKSMHWNYLIKPFAGIKEMDHKEVFKMKFKQLRGWAVEKYLDFIESIWPYYCRTIRFLKKANLI